MPGLVPALLFLLLREIAVTTSQSRQSLLMTVASKLPLLIEQAEELDTMLRKIDSEEAGKTEDDMRRRVERWAESATNALEAAERLIASEPARALADAAIQLMLAVSRAQIVAVSGLKDEERAAALADLERLLQSALPVVADAAGIDLANFGRAYYADGRTDPFYRGEALATAAEDAAPHYDPIARLKAAGFGS